MADRNNNQRIRKPEIERMLTVSTGHVTKDTLALLEREANGYDDAGITAYGKSGYGYFVYLMEDDNPHQTTDRDGNPTYGRNVPADLVAMMQYARDMGCQVLCLDADGARVPYLPWYAGDED